MDSNETPASAPRWESPAVPSAAGSPAPAPAPAPAARPAAALMRSRLALVAGAVGLVAVGGIGGFVLGQSSSATAGTSSDSGHFGRPGTNGGEGFSGQLPGGGQFAGGGQFPGGAPGGAGDSTS